MLKSCQWVAVQETTTESSPDQQNWIDILNTFRNGAVAATATLAATEAVTVSTWLADDSVVHIFGEHVSMKLLEVSLSCLHFSFMFSEGEVKSH
jgi:hypothetical protein